MLARLKLSVRPVVRPSWVYSCVATRRPMQAALSCCCFLTPVPRILSYHCMLISNEKQNLYLYISINSRTLSIVAPAWAMSEQTNKPKTRSQHERALSLSSFACYLFSFAFSACLCMCGSASGGAIEQKIGFQTRIPFLKLGFQTPRFGDNQ